MTTPDGTISPDGAWRWERGAWVPNLPTLEVAPATGRRTRPRRNTSRRPTPVLSTIAGLRVAARFLARWWKVSVPAALVLTYGVSRSPALLEVVFTLTGWVAFIVGLVMLVRGGPLRFVLLVLACLPLMFVAGFARGSAKNARDDYEWLGNPSDKAAADARSLRESLALTATWTSLLAASTLMRAESGEPA